MQEFKKLNNFSSKKKKSIKKNKNKTRMQQPKQKK
jgi:hypothetical protein